MFASLPFNIKRYQSGTRGLSQLVVGEVVEGVLQVSLSILVVLHGSVTKHVSDHSHSTLANRALAAQLTTIKAL